MTGYKRGAIVLLPFPFSDQSSAKNRPAVVVKCKQVKMHTTLTIDSAGQVATGAQSGLEGLGGLVVGHHHDDRLARSPRQQRQKERTRRGSEPGYTPAPRTEAQMPLYALEGGGVLQLRENFADEREDHALPV